MRGIWAKSILWLTVLFIVAACARSVPAPLVYGSKSVGENRQPATRGTASATVSVAAGAYRVAADETLYAIARRSGVDLRDLITANNLRPPYRLQRGQRLQIPAVRYHKVAAGETLYSIARRHRVSLYALSRRNQVAAPYKIRPGQRLRLPSSETRVATADSPEKAAAVPKPGQKPRNRTSTIRTSNERKAANRTPNERNDRKARNRKPVTTQPPARASSRFAWPVQGRVISRFGVKANGLHNDGINIAVKPGAPVRAADNGVVVYAGNELRGFGNLLLLRHKGGWLTAYGHNQTLVVKVGDVVRQGQRIARAGSSGNTTRPQLHFEIRKGRRAVNPARYLASRQARLKPSASRS